MKNLINLLLVLLLFAAGCTSAKKTDNGTNNTDTSGYMKQPQDKTQMNDTAQMQTDSMKHYDSIPH